MSSKDKPIETKGSTPLDETPEETARKTAEALKRIDFWAFSQNLRVRGCVKNDQQAEYFRRYLTVLFANIPGLHEMLVAEFMRGELPEPEILAYTLSEQKDDEGRGTVYLERFVVELLMLEPDLRVRLIERDWR